VDLAHLTSAMLTDTSTHVDRLLSKVWYVETARLSADQNRSPLGVQKGRTILNRREMDGKVGDD